MNPPPDPPPDPLPDRLAAPSDAARPESAPPRQQLAPEDFYMEGPYLVFTAAYHRKRGTCCNSACRHCPYGHSG